MSTEQYKLTTSQAVAAFLAEERAEELDVITAAMTKEQHVAALEAEGISREAQAAYFEKQQQKIRAILAKQAAPENVVPIRKDVNVAPLKRRFSWRDAGVGSGVTGIAAAVAMLVQQAATVAPSTLPYLATAAASPPAPAGVVLREEAFAACGRAKWRECLDKLDRAKAIDPSGDDEADVQNARAMATHAPR